MKRLFSVGDLQISKPVKRALQGTTDSLWDLVIRHVTGDWGELIGGELSKMNQKHLLSDGPLTSAYLFSDELTIMVVTNAERTITGVFTFQEFLCLVPTESGR